MGVLGNLLWFVFCGFWLMLGWGIAGLLWCVTVIGLPVGVQCFKIAGFAAMPFGREVQTGGSPISLLLNILWIVFGGLELAAVGVVIGILLCITVVGMPFGMQCFKLARLTLMPFGARVR